MQAGEVWLPTGGKEPIEIRLSNLSGNPLLDATNIVISVRRISDGEYYDWDNKEFRPEASVVKFYETLEQVDKDNRPGLYFLSTPDHNKGFDTSKISDAGTDDEYEVEVTQTGVKVTNELPQGFHIKMGGLADKIISLPESVADAVWDAMQADHQVAGSMAELLARIVALQKEHYFIDNTTYNAQGLLTFGRVRLFRTKAEAEAATKGGTGEGEFATYELTTLPKVDKPELADTVTSVKTP